MHLASDDLAAHVPQSLRQQIGQEEYVNLALLLKGSVELADFCSGTLLRLSADGHIESRPKECKDKIKSIDNWTDAFLIFASIYLRTYPNKCQELLHYMWTVRECASRQGGLAWRTYDEQFRLRQAITPASWAHINNDLWWRCLLVKDAAGSTNRSSRIGNTCVFFSKSKCFWHNCKFQHACSNCGLPHPAFKCTSQAISSVAESSFNAPGSGVTSMSSQGTQPANAKAPTPPFQYQRAWERPV